MTSKILCKYKKIIYWSIVPMFLSAIVFIQILFSGQYASIETPYKFLAICMGINVLAFGCHESYLKLRSKKNSEKRGSTWKTLVSTALIVIINIVSALYMIYCSAFNLLPGYEKYLEMGMPAGGFFIYNESTPLVDAMAIKLFAPKGYLRKIVPSDESQWAEEGTVLASQFVHGECPLYCLKGQAVYFLNIPVEGASYRIARQRFGTKQHETLATGRTDANGETALFCTDKEESFFVYFYGKAQASIQQ